MSGDNAGIKVNRRRGYTVVYNDLLPTDGSLSARAWGIYVYLVGRPDGWETRVGHLRSVFKEGRDALYSALAELVAADLMEKESIVEAGLRRTRYVVNADPVESQTRRSAPDTDSQDSGNPEPGSQDAGTPEPENPAQVSTEVVSTDQATTDGTSVGAGAPSDLDSKRDLNEGREDVERLCVHLADRIEANGSKRPTIGKAWRDAARLLMDVDGHPEDKVRKAIDWCQDHEFWRSNILSMPKLREKYETLRLQAQRDSNVRSIGNRHSSGDPAEAARLNQAWGGATASDRSTP